MEFKIPFSGRAHTYSEEEINTVVSAMKNANPLTQGKYLNAFEKTFRHYIGAEYAFAVAMQLLPLKYLRSFVSFESETK